MPVRRAPLAIVLLLATLGACSPNVRPAPAPRPSEPPPPPRAATPPPPPAPDAPAPELPSTPDHAAPSFANFRPTLHGFRFPNRFTGSPLPFSLGGLEKHLNLPNHYGLCGGMSFAAADLFLARVEPPALLDPPDKDDALYTYLYSRQIESLGESLAFVPKFARWMAISDSALLGTPFLTCTELPDILASIRAGRPTLLGLVLTSVAASGQLWENHQVLAYAADTSIHGVTLIRIYDPNFPHNDNAVLRFTGSSSGPLVLAAGLAGADPVAVPLPGVRITRLTGRRETPVRGVFQMPYTPKSPPPHLRADRALPAIGK